MRAPVGLLLIGLCLAACTKKEPPAPSNQDSQTQIGASDNGGPSLGDPTPQPTQGATQPVTGVTPTKVILPTRTPAFGAIGTPGGAAQQPGSTPASTPTTPVAANPATTAPPTTGGVVATGRGVPPPPGGRPKPGTK